MVYLNKKITRELDMYGILSLLTFLSESIFFLMQRLPRGHLY